MTQPKIRRDGKPARASRLGVPQTSLAAPSTFQDGEKPGTWHDLVLPGPKGNPSRSLARREERGQVTPYTGTTEHRDTQRPGGYRQPAWLQRSPFRFRARGSGGIDRSKLTEAAKASRIRTAARTAERRAARAAA